MMARRWAVRLLLVLAYFAIFILPLGVRPVAIADEARYSEIPREMIATGDWIVPRLDGLRYFEKPPLGYWLTAVSMSVLGESAFAVRLSSALAAGLTAFLMVALVRRETDDHPAAMPTGFVYLTSVLVVVVGTTNLLDGVFTLCVTASLAAFLASYRATVPRARRVWEILFGLACALAFLAKGFLGFVLPAIVIVPFLVWERRMRELPRLAMWPLAIAVMALTPWAILIERREADFWRYFVWEEHVRRFMLPTAQHPEPAWFFVEILVVGALPWTLVLPAAAMGLARERAHASLLRFLVCWFVMPFLFFSASRGKLGTYILPCFPALAALTSIGLLAYLGRARRSFDVAVGALAGVAALAALAVAGSEVMPGMSARLYPLDSPPRWVLPVVGLIVCSAICVTARRSSVPAAKLVAFALAPVLLFAVMPLAIPDSAMSARSASPFLASHRQDVPDDAVLFADASRVAAVCWFYKRNDVVLLGSRGELDYGLGYPDAAGRFVDVRDLQTLIGQKSERPIALVTVRDTYEQYAHRVPAPSLEAVADVGGSRALVLARYE